jgi:hypothetical protein
MLVSRAKDPYPFVGGPGSVDVKVAVAGVDFDDAGQTFLPKTKQVLLHNPDFIHHPLLNNFLDTSVTDPFEVGLQYVEVHQVRD